MVRIDRLRTDASAAAYANSITTRTPLKTRPTVWGSVIRRGMTVCSGPASQLGKIWTLRGTRIEGPELAAATMANVAKTMVPIAIRPATGPSVTHGREPVMSSGIDTRGSVTGASAPASVPAVEASATGGSGVPGSSRMR